MNLFTIHNVAASGGSICSQTIAAYTNSLLISEINPLAGVIYKTKYLDNFEGFQPGRVLDKALLSSKKDLSINLRKKYFEYQLQITIEHAKELNKNLLLRDHTHSTYPFKNKNNKLGINQFLNNLDWITDPNLKIKMWQPILTIRHPLDNYLSAKKNKWHVQYCDGSFDDYCKSLLSMQNTFTVNFRSIVLRYEDLCTSVEDFCHKLSSLLGFEQFSMPSIESINSVAITGKSGRKSSDIGLRKRQVHLLDDSLIQEVNNSHNYIQLCKLNGYNPDIDSKSN